MRKPIAEHNAELASHMAQWFPPVSERTPRVFVWSDQHCCWLAMQSELFPAAAAGWLNYDDKIELVRRADGTVAVIKRRDMSDAEWAALPTADSSAAFPPGHDSR